MRSTQRDKHLIPNLKPNLQGDTTNGFTTGMNIGLDLTDLEVGASDTAGGRGGPPP